MEVIKAIQLINQLVNKYKNTELGDQEFLKISIPSHHNEAKSRLPG